jgi:hypothetical protein
MSKRARDIEAMNSQYEERLAAEVDQELKSLPELQAPSTLIQRVSAAIEQRRSSPWYRQPWPAWPVPMRAAALAILAAFFAALCLGAWKLPDTEGYVAVARHAAGWCSGLATVWHALIALVTSLAQAVQLLGRVFLLGCFAVVALAWALCLGLGTACLRLALARR